MPKPKPGCGARRKPDAHMMQEALNPWNFIAAAYVIGVGGTVALALQSWLAMRRAEKRRDKTRGK